MPICNSCECEFDVETAPGALMFGHPATVKEAVPVWKAHLCQACEAAILADWKRKPLITRSAKQCTQCGSHDLRIRFQRQGMLITSTGRSRHPSELVRSSEYDFYWTHTVETNHNHVTCRCCGYDWRETADVTNKPNRAER